MYTRASAGVIISQVLKWLINVSTNMSQYWIISSYQINIGIENYSNINQFLTNSCCFEKLHSDRNHVKLLHVILNSVLRSSLAFLVLFFQFILYLSILNCRARVALTDIEIDIPNTLVIVFHGMQMREFKKCRTASKT